MTEPVHVSDPTERQALIDAEHVWLLSLGYWVFAGTTAFWGLLGLLYMFMGQVVSGAIPGVAGVPPPPPLEVGRLFSFVGAGFYAASMVAALLMFHAGNCLRDRRGRIFSQVIAALTCLCIPYGTVLGVFTFIVLGRASVRQLFERPSEQHGGQAPARRSLVLTLALALLAGLILAGAWTASQGLRDVAARAAASSAKTETSLSRDFARYLEGAPNKAMLLTYDDPDGMWVWSWRVGHVTLGEAIRLARKGCEEARQKSGIANPCRLYAVNNEVVFDYTDAALQETLGRFRSMEGEER
jgi:hypothetical protein